MIIELFLLTLSLTNTLIGVFIYWPIQNWYDFYIPIVLFLGTYIAALLIIWIVFDWISFLIKPKHNLKKNNKIAKFLLVHAIKYIDLHAGARIKVIGKEKIPANHRFLFVCNHISRFDPMISIDVFSNKDIAFITKPSNMNIPIGGKLIKTLHFQAIVREDPLKSLEVMNNSIKMIKDNLTSIGVYPEGTRSKNGELGPFHEGVFNIALKAKCPIVVTTIINARNIHKNFPFKPTKVIHEVVCVLNYEDIEGKTCKAISEEVRQIIYNNLRKHQDGENIR